MSCDIKETTTGTALKPVLLKFIPPQFLKDVDFLKLGFNDSKVLSDGGVGLLQKLMDNSKNQLKMYGSAKELLEHLNLYQDFPSSHKFFGIDVTEEFYVNDKRIMNSKGDQFICKQDILVLLQHVVFHRQDTLNKYKLPRQIAMIYLKTCEEKLNGCCEFVKFDKNLSTRIEEKQEGSSIAEETYSMCTAVDSGFEAIFETWKKLIPECEDEQSIRKALQSHFQQYPLKKSIETYIEVYRGSKNIIEVIQRHMRSYPEFYLPYAQIKHKQPLAAVRIFFCGEYTVVMKSELFNAINIANADKKPMEYQNNEGFWSAIPIEKVMKKYKDLVKNVEFLQFPTNCPVLGKPVPILAPNGTYCIFTFDAYKYIIRRLIVAHKIFQKIKSDTWRFFVEYMIIFTSKMKVDEGDLSFVSLEIVESLEKLADEHFKQFEKIPTKNVRDVRKVGFNLNFLKKELRDLGLNEIFPDIESHASAVYDGVLQRKQWKYLRTCDLFEAVAQCQFECVSDRMPTMFVTQYLEDMNAGNEIDCITKHLNIEANSECNPDVEIDPKLRESILRMVDKVAKQGSSFDDPKGHSDARKAIMEVDRISAEGTLSNEEKRDEKVELKLEKCKECAELEEQLSIAYKESFDQYRILNVKMEKMEKQIFSKENENELLKTKILKLEESEETNEESMKKMNDSKNVLTKKLSQSENQLKAEKHKIHKTEQEAKQKEIDLNRKISSMEMKHEKEIAEKQTFSEALQKKVDELKSELERSEELRKQKSNEYESDRMTESVKYEERINIEKNAKKHLEKELEKWKRLVIGHKSQRNRNEHDVSHEMDSGFSEKDRIIEELCQTNIHLTGQIEQQNMTIQGFFRHFGQIKMEFSNAETQTVSTNASEYTGTRHSLLRLQKIKDTFWNGNQIKTAKEMMQKLISMSNRCEIHQFANYELQQFETNIHNYVQEVERNIQKMKRTNDPMEMTSLPQPPSLSDRFMNEYWNEIDKERNKMKDSESVTSSESNESKKSRIHVPPLVSDSECLICFEEMKQEEKTLKCNECKKETHMNCASQWLSVHRSCPHCRKELLDPDEFPPLS